MRISDWSSDVCSSDLGAADVGGQQHPKHHHAQRHVLEVFAYRDARANGPHGGEERPHAENIDDRWCQQPDDPHARPACTDDDVKPTRHGPEVRMTEALKQLAPEIAGDAYPPRAYRSQGFHITRTHAKAPSRSVRRSSSASTPTDRDRKSTRLNYSH